MNYDSPAFRSSLLGLLARRLPLILGFALIGSLAGLALAGSASDDDRAYESRSLVVATTWELRIEGLSRMVETVVETNGFRQELERTDADAFGGPADFDESVSIVPVQDTVAVWLESRASTPELAQRRANLAGDVLVIELNRLGTDIGTFVVQDRGSLPVVPVGSDLSLPFMLVLGALGGLTIGSGLAVAWPDRERRTSPVDEPTSAEERPSVSSSPAIPVANVLVTESAAATVEERPILEERPPVEERTWSEPAEKKYGPPRHRAPIDAKP